MSATTHPRGPAAGARRVRKLCGADVELGNFVTEAEPGLETCREASLALLAEIDGAERRESPHASWCGCSRCRPRTWERSAGRRSPRAPAYDPQDWGRKFLPSNGSCIYQDLSHLEICLPEVLSARDHVACWHAMVAIAQTALRRANAKRTAARRIQASVNNSDGCGHSWGSHLNMLMAREAFRDAFDRRIHRLFPLAAFQVSSIVFCGQGKVGSERAGRPARFQLTQRSDFFETLTGHQTTYSRPLINSRDEGLCGAADDELARLHVIFYDSTLCHVASFLKIGVLQVIVSMLEAGRLDLDLALEDPVDAALRWSHDPTLTARCRMLGGRKVTALELQQAFLARAKKFAARGGCDEIVPDWAEILGLWEDTLRIAAAGDLPELSRRVDWALKLLLLQRAMSERPQLTWDSPEIKHLDQAYGSLDPSEGLYWACERAGLVDRIVSPERVDHFVGNPPADTRAFTRAMLLRLGRGLVDDVGWDFVRFRLPAAARWDTFRRVELADPLGFTARATGEVFSGGADLVEVLDALGADHAQEAETS